MRSISRVLGISVNTVSELLTEAGAACQEFHDAYVFGLECDQIECDEIWSFCYAKEHNAPSAKGVIDGVGDIWTWTAMDRDTKLLISWLVGDRDPASANLFIADLESRLAERTLHRRRGRCLRWGRRLRHEHRGRQQGQAPGLRGPRHVQGEHLPDRAA